MWVFKVFKIDCEGLIFALAVGRFGLFDFGRVSTKSSRGEAVVSCRVLFVAWRKKKLGRAGCEGGRCLIDCRHLKLIFSGRLGSFKLSRAECFGSIGSKKFAGN